MVPRYRHTGHFMYGCKKIVVYWQVLTALRSHLLVLTVADSITVTSVGTERCWQHYGHICWYWQVLTALRPHLLVLTMLTALRSHMLLLTFADSITVTSIGTGRCWHNYGHICCYWQHYGYISWYWQLLTALRSHLLVVKFTDRITVTCVATDSCWQHYGHIC